MIKPAFRTASRYHHHMGTAGRCALAAALLCLYSRASWSDDKKPVKPATVSAPAAATNAAAKNNGKPKVFDFTGLDLAGRLRTPQLLYFLERANEELERASLEKRSFVPSMVRSIDDEAL